MKTRRNALLLALAPVVGISSSAMHAQVNQNELAQQILSDNSAQRRIALFEVQKIGVQNTNRELRAAMLAALQQEANVHRQRYYAARRGEALEELQDAELVATLSGVVAELREPEAIPALAAALFDATGSLVIRALADFGEQAAASVLQVVTSPDGWHDDVDGGLVALRFMVERRGEHPLTARTIAQTRRAAEQRLTGKQYFTTLWRAIDLAVVLGDPGLRRIVELLASDRNEVFARGVENQDLLEFTQQRAADRLTGIPPLPRP